MARAALFFQCALASVALARTPSDPTPVSCSIDGLADYSRTMPFCDLTKQTRIFGSAQAPYDGNCTVGTDGWPTQDQFGLVFITETSGPPPGGMLMNGTYTLQFYGNGTLNFPVSTVTLVNQTFDAATGVTLAYLYVPYLGNGQLWISWRGASMLGGAPGAKNITLLQPGCSLGNKDSVTPALLQLVSRFDSLRFMDWASTNDNLIADWSERRLPNAPSYAAGAGNTTGIPWEKCVDLVNAVQRDMWVNIPAHATDDYILQFAKLLYATVDPSLFIYYEYSNEVWNWQFEQAHFNLVQANISVTHDGDPNGLNYDGCNNEGYWAWRRTAYMCKHIADIFKTVFGADNVGSGKRVRPILAGQVSAPFVVRSGLEYIEAVFGPPRAFFHAIAGAPYFGIPDAINNNPNVTVDDIFAGWDEIIHNMSLAQGVAEDNWLAGNMALAYHYGLQMRAYEGGPDSSGPNLGPAYLQAKGDAAVDPRIQARVAAYLTNWYAYGAAVGPLNYFVAGATNLIDQWGVYGLLYDMRIQASYKSAGVDQVRVLPRPPTPAGPLGSGIPTVPFTANCTADEVGARRPVLPPYHCDYFGANTTFDFFLQTTGAPAGTRLSATVFVRTPWTNATIGVQLGAGPEQVVACPQAAGGDWGPCDVAVFSIAQPAGVDLVRLRSIGPYAAFRTYSIANVSFSLV